MPPSPHHTRQGISYGIFDISSMPAIGVTYTNENWTLDGPPAIINYGPTNFPTADLKTNIITNSSYLIRQYWTQEFRDADLSHPDWTTNTALDPPPPGGGTVYRDLHFYHKTDPDGVNKRTLTIQLHVEDIETDRTRKRCGFSQIKRSIVMTFYQYLYEVGQFIPVHIEDGFANWSHVKKWEKTVELSVPTLHHNGDGERVDTWGFSPADVVTDQGGGGIVYGFYHPLPQSVWDDIDARRNAVVAAVTTWVESMTFDFRSVAYPFVSSGWGGSAKY